MNINKNDVIAGQPVLLIRELLRCLKGLAWDYNDLVQITAKTINLNKNIAKQVIETLTEEGYIEKIKAVRTNDVEWTTTIKGNSLALASAARPIKRITAEKRLIEIVERAKQINADDYYLYRVTKMLVFGSYLDSQLESLGDLDIAVQIEPKEKDANKLQTLKMNRINEAVFNGRIFGNIVEKYIWPEEEVYRYLKSRSRSISLHSTSDPILKEVKYKVIFDVLADTTDK